jgi:penicillin-binding protein 1C
VGPLRLATAMKRAGASPRLPPGAAPSLPLALGGAGVPLREMALLYAALANGALAEPRAAEAALAALVQPFPGPAGIAWKTGTSWGGRDAWAMGVDGRHVVGVWVGRPGRHADARRHRGAPRPAAARPALRAPARRAARAAAAAERGRAPTWRVSRNRRAAAAVPPARRRPAGGGRVVLRAAGGRRPLAFLVDGAPLPADPARREAGWTPPGPGLYRITVLDAEGAAARTELRVR